jgi:anti-sigma regulatory factor (Ser/Thr protein kinase)
MEWFAEAHDPSIVHAMRKEIGAYLARHAQPGADLDAAEIVVDELIANVVRHAEGPMWVSLDWTTEEPVLTVRDVGPGFSMPEEFLLPPATALSGRGLYIVSQMARSITDVPRATGAHVRTTLPVFRRPEASFDPPRSGVRSLPTAEEAQPDGTFGREPFLRALVVMLSDAVEAREGPDAAAAAVADVGTHVAARIEEEYRLAQGVDGPLTVEQIGDLYVRLKAAIDGGFRVESATPDKIVLANTRCPFGDAVRRSPSLCRMTSSVFGGIAARSVRGAAVQLEERIAVGDPECRVTVWLGSVPREARPFVHVYGELETVEPAQTADGV